MNNSTITPERQPAGGPEAPSAERAAPVDALPITGATRKNSEDSTPRKAGDSATMTRSRTSGVSIDIPIGTRMTMNFINQKESYPVEMLGYSLYEYLIFKLPRLPALRSRLIGHEAITMRYMHEGTVFGFMTETMAAIVRPGFILFCSYPVSVEQLELRRHQRLGCLLPAVVQTSHGEYRCILQDLSHGGAKLVLESKANDGIRQIEAGANVLLDFTLFIGKSEVPVPSVVRSVSVEGVKVYLGVQFLDLPERLGKELEDYLSALGQLR